MKKLSPRIVTLLATLAALLSTGGATRSGW
jgi:hypothetical protein